MGRTYPEMPPMRWAEIDTEARKTLDALFPTFEDFFAPQAFLKIFEGGLKNHFGIGYGVEDLPFGEEGYFNFETTEIILDTETYLSLMADEGRARFTLAHEIGHGILHNAYMCSIKRGNGRANRLQRSQLEPYRDPECQANRYAGEFLMPTALIQKYIQNGADPYEISRKFKTSHSAALIKYSKFAKNTM